MKQKVVLLLAVLFMAGQALLGAALLHRTGEEPLDTVAVNELVQLVARQWDGLERGAPLELPEDSPFSFTVISREGAVLAATGPEMPRTVNEAVARRDTILDLEWEGEVVGKLLLDNGAAAQRTAGRGSLLVLLGGSMLELLLLSGYLLYLNRAVFRPFRKLRLFAERVAGGDLDFPLEMDRKNVFGAFTEGFDLMREELKAARLREQAANRSKKELVAKLSHDIKTPVASIEAVSELMELSAATEKERTQLAVIQEKAQQIDRLISDLFHATLEELQELPVNPGEQSSTLLPGLLAAADYQDRAEIGRVPECMLVFDPMRLQQVFDNLLSNSYKYADSPLRVTFSFAGQFLVISVEDFGPGVPEEDLPLLVGKYFRGKNAEGKNGAGLGLFISRYLLEQMRGRIACRNTGSGFCAEVSLKLAGAGESGN